MRRGRRDDVPGSRRTRPLPSIRTALLAGAIVVSLPSFGLLAWQTIDRAREATASVKSAALERAREVGHATGRVIDEGRRILAGYSIRPLVRLVDAARCDPQITAWAPSDPEFGQLVLFDAQGRAACRPSGPASVTPRDDAAGETWFGAATATAEPVLAGPLKDAGGSWLVMLAVAVRGHEGQPTGVLALSIDVGRLHAVADAELAAGESLTLVNETGLMLARVPDDRAWVGTDVRGTELGAVVLADGEAVTSTRFLDDVERVLGVTDVPGTDWRVYAGVPTTRVAAVWADAAKSALGLIVADAILVLAFAIALSRLVSRSARTLTAAADAMAVGRELEPQRGLPFAEAAMVFERFARMAARRAETERHLAERERDLVEAQRIGRIGSWTWTPDDDTISWSEEAHRLFDLPAGALPTTGAGFREWAHPDDRTLIDAADARVLGGSDYDVTHRLVLPGGEQRWVRERGELVPAGDGPPQRVVGTTQDISADIAREVERARMASAVEQTAEAVLLVTMAGTIEYANPAFARLYGHDHQEVVGRNVRILKSGLHSKAFWDDVWALLRAGRPWTGSLTNRHRAGHLIEVESVISPVADPTGRVVSFVQTDRDVTRERALEAAVAREARERETIQEALRRMDPSATPEDIAAAACAAISRLDGIDSAAAIELTPGGGRFMAVEGLVAGTVRAGEVLHAARARYLRERAAAGPWEEAWRSRRADGLYGGRIRAAGVRRAAYAPVRGPGGALVGVLGVAAHSRANAERLIERLPALATIGSVVGAIIAPRLEARHHEEDTSAAVSAMLDRRAFSPHFQPIVELRTGRVVGYEALTRFSDGGRPDHVFEQAARSGLGLELETATLSAAVAAARVLPDEVYLSLNVSPQLIGSGRLARALGEIRREVVLEITEHAAVADYAALRAAAAALGPNVSLAVDDAGAGYASLLHTLELEPDLVKLDMSLIRGIGADQARQALIAGIGYFAAKRRIRLVAEGIETRAELTAVRDLAVSYGQGYLLGRPQPADGPGPWPTVVGVGLPRVGEGGGAAGSRLAGAVRRR